MNKSGRQFDKQNYININEENKDYVGNDMQYLETKYLLFEYTAVMGKKNDDDTIYFNSTGMVLELFHFGSNITYPSHKLEYRKKTFLRLLNEFLIPNQNVTLKHLSLLLLYRINFEREFFRSLRNIIRRLHCCLPLTIP